jgi:xylan 1,4-beta-xylosidase
MSCAGGTDFFQNHDGVWWTSFFCNDTQSPFREKAAIARIDFDAPGRVIVTGKQPSVPDWKPGPKAEFMSR